MMELKLLISLVSVAPWHAQGNFSLAWWKRLLDLGRANKPQGPRLAWWKHDGTNASYLVWRFFYIGRETANQPNR